MASASSCPVGKSGPLTIAGDTLVGGGDALALTNALTADGLTRSDARAKVVHAMTSNRPSTRGSEPSGDGRDGKLGEKKNPPGIGAIKYTGPTGHISLPGTHWTENPKAMQMMQSMSFIYTVPSLQPRLTKFHGTRVPVLVVFFLLSTEVGRLASLDTFWKRIVQVAMVWQGIYCRDYCGRPVCRCDSRCVWQALQGREGQERCLFHLGKTHPAEFVEVCKKITAIPGRSSEELLDDYRSWRAEQKALTAVMEEPPRSRRHSNLSTDLEDGSTLLLRPELELALASTAATALPPSPYPAIASLAKPPSWNVRAHASYGLSVGHARDSTRRVDLSKPRPVMEVANWSRRRPAGRPPLKSILQESPRSRPT